MHKTLIFNSQYFFTQCFINNDSVALKRIFSSCNFHNLEIKVFMFL